MLNDTLGRCNLSGSLLTINTMKVLARAEEDGGISLTKSGAFSRKFVAWAAEDFQWPGYEPEHLYSVYKVLNEPDYIPLTIIHELLVGSRLLHHYKGRAVLTNVGKGIIGDHGALQAELFDAFFLTLNHGAHERLRINYHDHDYARFLWLVQNRLYDWVPLTELAGWCLPTDLVSKDRFNACFYLRSRLVRPLLWLGLIERHHEDGRLLRIEGRRYRKTSLCDRFMHFNFMQDMSITIH